MVINLQSNNLRNEYVTIGYDSIKDISRDYNLSLFYRNSRFTRESGGSFQEIRADKVWLERK